jgi:hypothetical protein
MKLNDGIVFYATKEAEKQYKNKETTKKEKKFYCPSCELDLRNKKIKEDNYFVDTINEDILKDDN